MAKMAFLMVNNFFCIFKNTDQKKICASVVLKAEIKPKHENKKLWGVFLKNQKHTFLVVQNSTFYKSNLKSVFLRLFFNVNRSCMPSFIKNINIWAPWFFVKWKLWRACAGVRGAQVLQKFGFGLLKSYLTFG